MHKFTLFFICLLASLTLTAQNDFSVKPTAANPASVHPNSLRFAPILQPSVAPSNTLLHLRPRLNPANFQTITRPITRGISVHKDPDNGQVIALRGRPALLPPGRSSKADAYAYLAAVAPDLGIADPDDELRITEEIIDRFGQTHLRLAQYYQGIPVFPADARLHGTTQGYNLYTGRLQPTPTSLTTTIPTLSEQRARTQVQGMFSEHWANLNAKQLQWISGPQLETILTIFAPTGQSPKLAWHVNVRPNLLEHTSLMLDAHSGEVLARYTHTCGFADGYGHLGKGLGEVRQEKEGPEEEGPEEEGLKPWGTDVGLKPDATAMMDGPATARIQNLYDQFITINTYEQADTFLLVDGVREMARVENNQLLGILLTYDGLGSTPLREDFAPNLSFSLNNQDWTKTEASVHSNAGAAYQYFQDQHERSSIDGAGGNIYSFANISETDGTEMDNAFWNGRALFYGNGIDAFQRLPRGLDVAGHEMAHGVIQATAGLIYEEQSGAMNESFADIFGYLIEGETGDYRIGEDVVTSFFPSGTMRDLRNPNNGGTRFGQRGWQPAHMDEYVTLPNTEQGDFGGVHINSGITNRAFYLFSSDPAVGDARAEKVYYDALNLYLTRSARFADLRIAVVQASEQFGTTVVAAAENAFAAVGIGGEAGDYTVDLEENEGDRFLLLTNTSQTALFRADENGTLLDNPLVSVGIGSRPSLTDDGSAAVFVDDEGQLRVYNLVTRELNFIESEPRGTNWRNIAISKDGNRIAVTTTDNDNRILIFDFPSQSGQWFNLYNPTTATGALATGDVRYADALEWEPYGEFLMYDALSELDDGLTFWDIGFLRVWAPEDNQFGDGTVFKLPVDVPSGISIGNPTFSKNSPYIIAYEEVDFSDNTFTIVGANVETGASADIFSHQTIGYPNYSMDDSRLVFDAKSSDTNEDLLAIIPLAADKISAGGQAAGLIPGGHWGYYYATGSRDLNTSVLESSVVDDQQVKVYPTLTQGDLTVESGAPQLAGPLQVLDLAGRVVLKGTATSGQQTISLHSLPAGCYFIAIPLHEGTVIRKIFRQ